MQSHPSLDELRARLLVIRDAGVAFAKFDERGCLLEVCFAPYDPNAQVSTEKDTDPSMTVLSEVEQAQMRLASGAHRRHGVNTDGS